MNDRRTTSYYQHLGWWLREPEDRLPYRGNIRGVFWARQGVAVGIDLRKVKRGTSVELSRPQTFIADGKTAATSLPLLLSQRCPGCEGAALSLHESPELDEPQVACRGCGAMYDLASFVALRGYPLVASWGLRLEGRWGANDHQSLVELGPTTLSSRGAQASKATLALARACQPTALAVHMVDDQGLAALGPQSRLEALRVWHTKLTDAGLASIARLDTLRDLNAGNNAGLSDQGIAQLSTLSALTTLNLEQTALGDAGLAVLALLPSLRSLRMARTQITDEGLRALRRHPSLEQLDIGSNPITDAGIEHLTTMPSLKSVIAYSTKIRAKKAYPFLR
jgi:hypothetical protein